MSDTFKRVLISGGGTGGHIFPALSIASAIKRRSPDCEILFVGAQGRMEMERVPAAGFEIKGLPVAGFDRKRPWRNVSVLWKLWKSLRMARIIVKDFKPQVAIGVGGYCAGPTLKAAQRAGIPTLLQEQNSYAGVTNKLLAAKAGAVCTAYENMDRFFPADRIKLTGNPVRPALLECEMTPSEARKALGFDPDRPLVLVVGGSLGALTINKAMAAGLDTLLDGNTQIMWQTGRSGEQIGIDAAAGRQDVVATPFISDMATAYRAADLVVSRAGAGTISELQLLGKPAILVPSPNVAEDHQRKNAMALVERSAAVMIPDAEASERLAGEIKRLVADTKMREELSRNISAMALHNADEKIVDAAENLINKTDK
ncbi:MAG: undecaprenyldiphospho-muramoylpentapeptide beta-N-acetylglucosaminyltransferase [Muribaculaceae bacterium]|nr:undecaprenyldiphospho-muramoylpentapeptide beta-N-acetylglucosaminyltransferase [Muribaculaceae bacterium]